MMTNEELIWLTELACDCITKEEFMALYPKQFGSDTERPMQLLREALVVNDLEEMDVALRLLEVSIEPTAYTTVLNKLLIDPNHRQHQYVAKALQDIADPSSVPFVRQVLESKFSYLEYSASDSDVIAKWFSWLLFSIGTTDAIALMRKYAETGDVGVQKEMQYRFNKWEKQP